jgi:putative endonuclease
MKYVVYLLLCSDDTLYCGITNHLDRRISEHNRGIAAKYTRGRTPVKLLGFIPCESKGAALTLEYKIKQMEKSKKLQQFQ